MTGYVHVNHHLNFIMMALTIRVVDGHCGVAWYYYIATSAALPIGFPMHFLKTEKNKKQCV